MFKPKLNRNYFVLQLCFATLYLVAARIGIDLQDDAISSAAIVWAPSGIALAWLLIAGIRHWPAILIATAIANYMSAHSLPTALLVGVGNAFSTAISAFLLNRYASIDARLSRLRDMIALVFGGVLLFPFICATLGCLAFYRTGLVTAAQMQITWTSWFVGDALGVLIYTPLIMAWRDWPEHRAFFRTHWSEAAALLVGALCMALFVFAGTAQEIGAFGPILSFLLFPFVIWSALRLGLIGSTTSITIISLIAIWGTSQELGPFITSSSITDLFLVQGYSAILAMTGLVIAVSTEERKRAVKERQRVLSEWEKIELHSQVMRESQEFLDSVIDNLPNMVFVKDARDLRFVRFNKAGEDLLGYDRADLIGKNDYDFFPPDQADHFTAFDQSVLAQKSLVDIPEERIKTRNHGERILHTRKIPILDKNGDPIFLLGISEDITDYKQAELQRTRLETEAQASEAANQTKSLFLANMSHEIRTPLGAILGFTDLLKDPNLTAFEREQFFGVIGRNGKALTQIIDDILDLSKVEAGHLEIEHIEVSLPDLINDVSTLLELRAREKGLEFKVELSHLPNTIVSDPTRLRQILINIVGNAIKFTEKGGVTLRAEAVAFGDAVEKVVFSVIDTGPGISPEQSEKLFSWFTQADSSTTRKFGGTGLGLALSRRLARCLGGDVVLGDSTDSGSCFVVSIATNMHIVPTAQSNLLPAAKNNIANRHELLIGLRVLLVDDAPDNRALVEKLLEKKGILVDLAQNGEEAIERATATAYDLILMDVQMPILGGLEATQELRRRGLTIPIVALTAHAMKEEREKTFAAGCNAHLTKPIDIPTLFNTIAILATTPHNPPEASL